MSDGITDHARNEKRIIEQYSKNQREWMLPYFETEELLTEISKRDGVKTIKLTAGNIYGSVERRGMGSDWVERTPVVSPATILVVKK